MKMVATRTKLELVTHPVRLRILLTLAGAERTPRQVAAALHDVPPSSIYRHLQQLQAAGLVEVVRERRVRGAVERTLRVRADAARIGPDEARELNLDEQRQAVIVMFTQLLHEFDSYLQQPDRDPVRDGAGVKAATLYASDAEWTAAIEAMRAALMPLIGNEPRPDRRLRRFATVALPLFDRSTENDA